MSIPLIRLLFDFGLLVLIWLVQLVIYPSFLYYEQDNLKRWHENIRKNHLCGTPLDDGAIDNYYHTPL